MGLVQEFRAEFEREAEWRRSRPPICEFPKIITLSATNYLANDRAEEWAVCADDPEAIDLCRRQYLEKYPSKTEACDA